MPRARLRVCPKPGCPTLLHPNERYCPGHLRDYEQARGTRQARGYDNRHDKLRAQWAPRVATGTVNCWRCRQPITAGEPWDLGHMDDRTGYGGPEHQACNRSAAGRTAH
jgi:hypothetical protein